MRIRHIILPSSIVALIAGVAAELCRTRPAVSCTSAWCFLHRLVQELSVEQRRSPGQRMLHALVAYRVLAAVEVVAAQLELPLVDPDELAAVAWSVYLRTVPDLRCAGRVLDLGPSNRHLRTAALRLAQVQIG